ncbi:MAG: flavodoxin family protein [Promethearchaeota archaeon]|jgi:multimeric flavodoxin WrbA
MVKENRDYKIIGLLSSPHKNGNSATLARKVLSSAEKMGIITEELYLPDYHIEFCRGCMSCCSGYECVINDDLNVIVQKLMESDGLVLSSPTYGLSPNAMMMNFLQRAGIYCVYRSALGGKYMVGIASAGRFGAKKVAKKLSQFADGLFRPGFKVGILGAKGAEDGWGGVKDYFPVAEVLGKNLALAILKQKKYPFQGLFMKVIGALFMHKIMKKNLINNRDGAMKGVYEFLFEEGLIN